MRAVASEEDASAVARVVRRIALHYAGGADPALDRPAHVRAASGLCWIGPVLAVVSDDASSFATFSRRHISSFSTIGIAAWRMTSTALMSASFSPYTSAYPDIQTRDMILATGMADGMEASYARLEREVLQAA